MNRRFTFKKLFATTAQKVTSALILVAIGASVYFYFDFYKKQINKVRGYWCVYRGDKAYKKKNLQNAINYYERAIVLHPGHYRAMYNLANIYVAYEDYYQALKNYEKALNVRPDYEVARINYAIILSESYKTDEAIEQYRKVISNKPKFVYIPLLIDKKKTYLYNCGVAYYNMGLAYRSKSLLAGLDGQKSARYLRKASESYEEAAQILNSYNANYNLGLIHQLLKNKKQAGRYYCLAMEKGPMEYEAHFNLAILLNDMKEYKRASEEFKKAGLLLDSKGDNTKTRYIYDIINDVHQKIAINDDEKSKKIDENMSIPPLKYKAGKVVTEFKSEKDKELTESFKKCAGYDLFLGEK